MSNSESSNVTYLPAIKNESEQFDIDPESSENSNHIGGDFLIEEKFIPEDPPAPYKLFICKFCSKVFKIKGKLTSHLRWKCKNKPTNCCKLCIKNFPSPSAYSDHLKSCQDYYKQIGNGEGRFVCPAGGCLAEFKSRESLYDHRKVVHTDRKFICQFCGFKFKTLGAKKKHERVLHPNGEKEPVDNRKFEPKSRKSRGKIPRPKKQIKLEKDDQNQNSEVSERPKRSTRKEVNYAKFESSDGMDSDSSGSSETSGTASISSILGKSDQDELESDSDEGMSNLDCSYEPKSQKSRMRSRLEYQNRGGNSAEIFNCSNCPQNFDSEKVYKDHKEICIQITVEDFLQCPLPNCSEKFSKEALTDYNDHIKSKHEPRGVNKQNTRICSYCKAHWFKSKQKYKDHCSLPHPFLCKTGGCDLQFITRKELDFHLKKNHFDEKKTFKCPEEGCGIKLTTKRRLEIHILSVHQKKFALECPICLKTLVNGKGKMYSHLKLHKIPGKNKSECEICHVFFPDSALLKTHTERCEIHLKRVDKMENNSQEEEYIIPDDLNPIDSLLAQYKLNSENSGLLEDSEPEIEPFPCNKCDLSFKSVYYLEKHRVNVHKTVLTPYYQSYHCELCDSSFKYKRTYDCHLAKSLKHKARLNH